MADVIGERLRYLRYKRDWTKQKLAEESGVPLATISLVERGKRSGEGLSVGTVRKLAKAFDIKEQELIGKDAESEGGPAGVAS